MSTITRKRQPVKQNLKPVTGTCAWIVSPGAFGAPGFCRISNESTTKVYMVEENCDGLHLVGYRLTKQGEDGAVYDVGLDADGKPANCDCPDGTYNAARPGGCRHRKALAVLLGRLNGKQ